MKSHYDFVGLGDVNIDYVVKKNLPFKFSSLLNNGAIWWEDIDDIPGGSALNICAIANKEGYRSLLLSKVGNDTAGITITNWLKEINVATSFPWVVNRPTGKAIIIRDDGDIRLLINNKQNANDWLSTDDIENHKNDITSCRVLYISGYCISLEDAPRFQAVLLAMEYARSAKEIDLTESPAVVFDVVPHRIYEKYTFEEFLKYTRNVDILISEVATMRRFLGRGSKSEVIDYKMAEETIKEIGQYFNRLVLRYGPSGCDEQLLWDQTTDDFCHNETGHHLAEDKRGFGDLLTIRCLRDFFKVLPFAAK
jgi:sugar/nucleoside kinase (ribokinase family)